ncbi:MAG: cytochrome c biogenesis protein CcsA [Planctomycetota bacterium]
MNKLLHWLSLLVIAAAACSHRAPVMRGEMVRPAAWNPGFVEKMAALEIQDNGRTKPLMTFASFLLYKVHGRRDLKFRLGDDENAPQFKLDPTEWLLDVWCFPEQAARYPLFRIENVGVLDQLGIANEGQTLDFEYVSYDQLLAKGEKLQKLAHDCEQIEAVKRTAVEEHIVQTFRQLVAYHRVHRQFEPLQHEFALAGDGLQQVFGGKQRVRLGEFVARAEEFRAFAQSVAGNRDDPSFRSVADLVPVLERVVELSSGGVGLFPPPADAEEWLGIGDVTNRALLGEKLGDYGPMFADLQAAVSATDVGTREAALLRYRDAVAAAAAKRGGPGNAELEAYYYRASWHYQSIHWFLFGFLLAAVSWALPRSRILWWGAFAVTALAFGMLAYDITLRCVITGRPPIKNLYDTFLFIGGVAVLILLVVEWVLPRRICLALAPLAGALLVMFARMFEVADGKDTMDPLVAVLDSNYWLATHVTMINTGYGAGLGAMLLANVWFGARMLGEPASGTFCKALVRMAYGVVCFSLMFSVVGTIWGGIWANESWGRFWGWDPKENGALLICLAQISMLHARMSGMVRDRGLMVWTGITGMVVTFSWFHTNLLGVGLHNYGFSSGLRDAVWTVYVTQLGWMALSGVVCALRSAFAGTKSVPPPLPADA